MTTQNIALVFFSDVNNGLPDPEGTRRLDKAVELYNSGQANMIMVTGGHLGGISQMHIYQKY